MGNFFWQLSVGLFFLPIMVLGQGLFWQLGNLGYQQTVKPKMQDRAPERKNSEPVPNKNQFLLPGKNFDRTELTRLVQGNKVRSLDEFLQLLPQELRSHYILMKKSNSTQSASPEYPRVILFSENADLILAFSGNPKDTNHDLEIISFNHQTKEFEFQVIKFPIDWNTGISSSKNIDVVPFPKSCISCHKDSPRPNWEPYPFWPGSYIENNVSVIAGETRKYIEEFNQGAKNHPLYKYLDTEQNLELNYKFPTTNFFNNRLNVLNAERITKYIKNSPDYKKFKYSIMAALLNCPNIPSYIPRNFNPSRLVGWQSLFDDTKKRYSKLSSKHKPHDDETTRIVTDLRYLMEYRELKMDNWSLSFQEDYFIEESPDLLIPAVIRELSKSDPDLLRGGSKDCDQLREKSLRAFSNK